MLLWGDEQVNLKVITDGEKDVWIKSVLRGAEKGEWEFPVIK